MLRQRLHARRQPQRLIRLKARRRDKIRQARLAESERPRLVEGDHPRFAESLQRLALAKQHAELGGAARAGHDRGRRGEAHRAGTGDDQHGDGIDEREGKTRLGADQHPDEKGCGGDGEDDRHENRGDAVDEALNGELRALRLLDHTDHAGKKSVGADARRLESEGSRAIHRSASHRGAFGFRDRRRLAGDHRFIDMRRAAQHDAVGGDSLSGTHEHRVADAHLLRWNVERLSVTLDMSDARRKRRKRGDRARRPALGARFEEPAEEDERDDHAGRFIVDMSRARRQQLRREGRDGGKEIGAGRSDRDKRIHVGRSAKKRREPLLEEDSPRESKQQARQDEGGILRLVVAHMRHDPLVEGGDHVAAHLEYEDRRSQGCGEDEAPQQRLRFLLARIRPGRERAFGLARLIAGRRDGAPQPLEPAGAF